MERSTKPLRRSVGRITVPAEAWERVFGDSIDGAREWVDVTCRNHGCPEYQSFETTVAEAVYDVLPPSCPACGHELEAI